MEKFIKDGVKVGIAAAAGLAVFAVGYVVGSVCEFGKSEEKLEELENENARLKNNLGLARNKFGGLKSMVEYAKGLDFSNIFGDLDENADVKDGAGFEDGIDFSRLFDDTEPNGDGFDEEPTPCRPPVYGYGAGFGFGGPMYNRPYYGPGFRGPGMPYPYCFGAAGIHTRAPKKNDKDNK